MPYVDALVARRSTSHRLSLASTSNMISDFSSVSSHPQTSPSCECKDLQPCPTVAPPCCQHLTLLKDEAFSFSLLIYHFSFQSLGCNSRYFVFLIKYSVWKHVRVFLLMFEVMNMWSCGVQQADNATDGSDFHWVSQTTRPKASHFYKMLPQKIIMSLHTCFCFNRFSSGVWRY